MANTLSLTDVRSRKLARMQTRILICSFTSMKDGIALSWGHYVPAVLREDSHSNDTARIPSVTRLKTASALLL